MRSPVWEGDWPVTQPWGPTTLEVEPLYGTIHWHCGVDIGMPTGTKIAAAQAGVVSRLASGLLGIQVGATCHYYIHIDRAVVGLGATVATGQLIAYSGAKVPTGGYLTGPHLHFECNAAPLNTPQGINPMPILEADDMTPEQEQTLNAIYAILSGSRLSGKATDQALHDIEAKVVAGGGTEPAEPAEPAEPKTISGTFTGTVA